MGEDILWIRGIYKREMFIRAVILSKSEGGRGFPMATMNVVPCYFHRKIEEMKPKEIPGHLIPRILVVFTQQLEILPFILTNATNTKILAVYAFLQIIFTVDFLVHPLTQWNVRILCFELDIEGDAMHIKTIIVARNCMNTLNAFWSSCHVQHLFDSRAVL